MRRRVGDLLTAHAVVDVVGREPELSALRQLLGAPGIHIAHIHGVRGIGKTTLLRAFAAEAHGNGAVVILLDCREIEPTREGLLKTLANAAATGAGAAGAEAIADCLGERADTSVIVLDSYEVFRLLDTWLRLVFVPLLPDNVRIVMAGRHSPATGWLTGGWEALTLNLPLGPLPRTDAARLLAGAGADPSRYGHVIERLHGHPLALRLAACAGARRPALRVTEADLSRVMGELSATYLDDVPDPVTRRLLEGATVVRRATAPLLAALFPDVAPEEAYERLRALAFVEEADDGLRIHEAIQDALAHALRARDPGCYRRYRRRAWQALTRQAAGAARPELWRYTADMLYLIENPVVREAFFPSDPSRLAVEHAQPDDAAPILALADRYETPAAAASLARWWASHPGSFVAVRGPDADCAGFCCRFDPSTVDAKAVAADPVTRAWQADLQERPLAQDERALFVRRWLSRDHGEGPGDVQAAVWLDLKRTYMEMRPHLRRVYLTLTDLGPYARAAQQLGFRTRAERTVTLDGRTYQCVMLDFGPASVDGWLAELAAAELGLPRQTDVLDPNARELVVDGRRTGLTPLEFGVMAYLCERPGKAVSRESLLHDVWHSDYSGWSNVVDTVIAGLRRKLGDQAGRIETVTGCGYRYRPRRDAADRL